MTLDLAFLTTLLLGRGYGIITHGELVLFVSPLPVMHILFILIAHPAILLMSGFVLCKCSGNVLIGYVIFKIK